MSRVEERSDSAEMQNLGERIYFQAITSGYDHRLHIPLVILKAFPHLMEECQLRCARTKRAVASVLQPRTIFEVGVGWGMSARAFLSGYPMALYFGIDNGDMGVDPALAIKDLPHAGTEMRRSTTCERFNHPNGFIDLIHIDGGHDTETKAKDIYTAVISGAKWILCDDAHDSMVARGIFDGLYRMNWKGTIPMCYFPNSHTGSLLIKNVYMERKDW